MTERTTHEPNGSDPTPHDTTHERRPARATPASRPPQRRASSRAPLSDAPSHGTRDAGELAAADSAASALGATSLWDGAEAGAFSSPPAAQPPTAGRGASLSELPELTDGLAESVIRDSLYDLIPLGGLELDLISAPEFVRLQGVKQLGFVYRVWPGATHTRFEHSLGVYYLMTRALRALLARPRERALLAEVAQADPSALRSVLAAALLHDVGHYPFSHAIEELGAPIIPHEQVGRRIIEAGAVAPALERHGLDPERIADLIDPPREWRPSPGDALLIRLLSGPLDVDKLDYLPRDARACNVPYGGVDVTRLLGSLRILERPGGPRLGVSDKGISPLNSLLHARQAMFDNVYWHHTNRAMMAMLLRAVQEALASGQLRPEELPGHDDASLLALLAEERMPPATRALVADLRLRRPYKVALEVSARAGSVYARLDTLFWDQGKRRRVEIALAEAVAGALGQPIAAHDILVDIPKPEKWEMDVLVRFSRPPLGMEPQMTWAEATGQRSDDLSVYERRQRRIRIVAREAVRDLLGERAAELALPVLERIPTL